MRVKCLVTGMLRLELKKSELVLHLPRGATAGDALAELARAAGAGESTMKSYLVFLRRGDRTQSISLMAGEDTPLEDEDQLILSYGFAGG